MSLGHFIQGGVKTHDIIIIFIIIISSGNNNSGEMSISWKLESFV